MSRRHAALSAAVLLAIARRWSDEEDALLREWRQLEPGRLAVLLERTKGRSGVGFERSGWSPRQATPR